MMLSDIGIVKRFAVVLVLCGVVWGDVEVRCKAREREALVSYKNGLIDEFGMLSSWRGEECCNWYGVVCSNTTGNVISLRLGTYDYRLRGNITPSLLDLHHLTSLALSNNDFGGHPIPKFIGSMKQLQHLYLRNSRFSGIVPPQLGNLTNLRTLDLSFNYDLSSKNLNWLSSLSLLSNLDLSSSLDLNHANWLMQIPHLRSLKELHLQYCYIRDDSLSVGLFVNYSSSASLSILDLSFNHLTSTAFNWLSNVSSSLVEIHLASNNLSGQIPDVLGRFIHLESLDVSYNMLQVDEIPKSLSNLTHLRDLGLSNNGLSGQLDEFIGNISSTGILGSLQILDLAYNEFTGSVPDLTPFSALTGVYLSSNKLTGTLPLSVGQLPKLRILEVSNNNNLEGSVSESHFIKLHSLKTLDLSFTSLKLNFASNWIPPFQLESILLAGCNAGPSFPTWIGTQTNLKYLDLSNVSIVDEVPMWLWSFSPSLQNLYISHNQITGAIPDLSSTSLQAIDVSDNKFSGLIPLFHPLIQNIQLNQNMFSGSISSICDIRHDKLMFLDLSNNQLSGELPNCWEKMPNLIVLVLGNNSFSNKIPHSLGSLFYLKALQLCDNNLSGELPSTLRFSQKLIFIDVGGNELTGEIPDWIGETYDLLVLNMGRNRLHGSIPLGICNLTRIQVLDVHMNNFSGKIPHCFHTLENAFSYHSFWESILSSDYYAQLPIYFFRFHEHTSVGWKGQESEYTNNLSLLKLIDFSSNRFTGNIPQTFSNMRGLRSLNLSGNILTGNIIPDIGQMENLEVLDLSNNQLTGKIPASMAQLHFLSFLDLSNNNLSGKIPSSTQLQTFNASSYAGNNGLCGQPLTLCPEDIPRPPTTTIAGDVFSRLSFMQECGISMGFGFIFGFWGLIGSFIIKKSWRYAFFNMMDAAGEWLCLRYQMNMKQRQTQLQLAGLCMKQ